MNISPNIFREYDIRGEADSELDGRGGCDHAIALTGLAYHRNERRIGQH